MRNIYIWREETGSTLPLFIGIVLFSLVLLMVALSTTEITRERVRQQSSADLGALAGANSLSKANETARLIDFSLWARNTTLDALYLAAAIATIGSAGTGASAFKVPLEFQKATIKPIEALEKTRAAVCQTVKIHAAANGMSIIKANDQNNSGLVVPIPLTESLLESTQRQKDLEKMIETYGSRIDQAKGEMGDAIIKYETLKEELADDGLDTKEMQKNATVKKLKARVHQTSGRVGGLMSQRNRRRRELRGLGGKNRVAGLQDKVLAAVYHPSTRVSFTSMLGGLKTGNNIAIAAGTVADGPTDETIGEEAIEELFSGDPVLSTMGDGLGRVLDAVNWIGQKGRRLENDYGIIGGYVSKALDKIGVIPPSLTQTRPALMSVDKALRGESKIYDLLRRAETKLR